MAEHDINAKSVIPRSKIKYFFKIKLLCIVLHFWEPNGSTESESRTRFIDRPKHTCSAEKAENWKGKTFHTHHGLALDQIPEPHRPPKSHALTNTNSTPHDFPI